MERPLQLEAGKLPPVPRAGFATGNEAEEGRAEARYVHTTGTSSQPQAFIGTSRDGEQIKRDCRRDRIVQTCVTSLAKCGREKQAKALAECGKWFQPWVNQKRDVKLTPCPCDLALCPECANRRAQPLIKKLKGLVNKPGRSYWFLTLTIPNVENFSKLDILQFQELWSKLWNSWVFQEVEDADRKPFRIYGAVRSIECVYNPRLKSWHPHIHVLFEAPRRLPRWWLTLLKHAWVELSGDSRYCHLQRAYSYTRRGKKNYNKLNEKALKEVCKYVTKCADFAGNPHLVDEFLTAFKGVRRIQCCGSFYGVKAAEPDGEIAEGAGGVALGTLSLRDEGYFPLPWQVHIRDTVLLGSGARQLSFPGFERVDAYLASASPPWELTAPPVVTSEQKRIEFAGAMPEKSEWQPSLFEGAA